jgi:hypothetical protein
MIHARRSDDRADPAPIGVPHRWQNRACGDSSARQAVQDRALRLAPHALQKFPDAVLPQDGHVVDGITEA